MRMSLEIGCAIASTLGIWGREILFDSSLLGLPTNELEPSFTT